MRESSLPSSDEWIATGMHEQGPAFYEVAMEEAEGLIEDLHERYQVPWRERVCAACERRAQMRAWWARGQSKREQQRAEAALAALRPNVGPGGLFCTDAHRSWWWWHEIYRDLAAHRPTPRTIHPEATCGQCGVIFAARRSDARYCSGACRTAAHRARL